MALQARPVPIGDYQPSVPVEEGLRRVIPERSGASIGPAVSDLGNSVEKVAQSEGANYATQALGAAQSEWTKQMIDRQQAAPPGAAGFTPALMKDYGDYVQNALKAAPNEMAAKFLQQRLQAFGTQLSEKAMQFEAQQNVDHNVNVAQQSIDSAGNELMVAPEHFTERLAERRELIGAMSMDGNVREKLVNTATQSLARSATLGAINKDPYAAINELQSATPQNLYTKVLDPAMRQQLIQHADEMLHQRVADAERIEAIQDKQERQNASAALTSLIVKSQSPEGLSMADVMKKAPLFSHDPAALESAVRLASGKSVESDVHVYLPLLQSAIAGQDVSEEVMSHAGKDLSKEDAARLLEMGDKGLPTAAKQGVDTIDGRFRQGVLDKYDEAFEKRHMNAKNEYIEWVRQNPTASPAAAVDQANSIADSYSMAHLSEFVTKSPKPTFAVGAGFQMNPDLTAAATAQAEVTHKISHEEAVKQMALIAQWRSNLDRMRGKSQ